MTQKEETNVSSEGLEATLIRLQERTTSQADHLNRWEATSKEGQQTNAAGLKELAAAFNNAFQKASEQYVTKQEFGPIKTAVMVTIGLICTSVFGAILAQFVGFVR